MFVISTCKSDLVQFFFLNSMQLNICESEVEVTMPKIIDSIATPTSFQNSRSYVTFVFSEWHIRKLFDRVHI